MRITESQIRQIIRQEAKRVITEMHHRGHDTHSASDSTLYQDAVQHFAEALADDPDFGTHSRLFKDYASILDGNEAKMALRQAHKLGTDRGDNIPHDYPMYRMEEKDSAYDDIYEPVDENHRPSNRNQMMFPLHALRESKLRYRR